MALLSALTVKKLNFKNSRWRTVAILKIVQSPYFCNRLTDVDEIWHGDARWSSAPGVKLIFFNFRQSYMADSRYLENRKTA